MKVLFVLNPKAGNRNDKDIESKLTDFALRNRFKHKIMHTEGSRDKKRINNALEEFRPSIVVAVGGDGTINMVASLLIKRSIHLGIVPTGSANGLAYNLKVPNNVEKALLKLVNENPKPLDVIVLNGKHHCLHLSDVGINARVVKRFEQEGSKGLAGYGKQAIKELFSRNTAFRLKTITEEFPKKSIKAEMLVIANAKSFGTGALINPLGEPADGKFEIIVIKPYPWWFFFRLVISFFTGNLHKLQNVKVYSTDEAILSFKKPQDVQVDGEMIEGVSSLELGIIPGALNVFY